MSTGRNSLAPLDWQQMPLSGRVLIEASAGTGKTFNIALVYLRLLLERELGVEKILVATFTDAAAQELRERLRRRLVEVEQWIAQPDTRAALKFDASLSDYLQAQCATDVKRQAVLRRIQLACADFDRAPIATFHALCQRIQRDYPLESGATFSASAATDEAELLRECVEDFWRRRFLGEQAVEIDADAVLSAGPDELLRDLDSMLARDARPLPVEGQAEIDQLIAELRSGGNIDEIRRLATDRTLYGPRKIKLRNRLSNIVDILDSSEGVDVALAEKLDDAFDPEQIEGQQEQHAPYRLNRNAVIQKLQQLRSLLSRKKYATRAGVLAAAYQFCREEIPRRARARDERTFSMLIDDVHARLLEDGGVLADRLAADFPAALIDEFQDTDNRQFEIFDRIFSERDDATRGLLVMIGDPKQAIFGFRGGDIVAYLRASAAAANRYALTVSYRSSTPLIGALNALYAHTAGGFGDAGISYQAITASGTSDATPYAIAGVEVSAPLVLHLFCDAGADDEVSGKAPTSENAALEDCADRIAGLLNDSKHTIGNKRVAPGDIAVLLPKNAQIVALRKLLGKRLVPCVGSGRGSVFETETADDLDLILFAVLNANDDRAVRGALTTRLLGATYADVRAWQNDAGKFEDELERFSAWHELARTRGVLALIESIVALRAKHWLAHGEGERVITDLRHLGELLAAEEGARHGLDGLYAWLVAMRRSSVSADVETAEARQLRIESDAQRVQLLTLHNAKGLEFPIVFLPLAWRKGGHPAPNVLTFHVDGERRIDLGSRNFRANRTEHFREDLEERLRLLYVALTRAKYAVHIYCIDDGAAHSSDEDTYKSTAIQFLLRQAQRSSGAETLERLAAALAGMGITRGYTGPPIEFDVPEEPHFSRLARTPLPSVRPFQWLHSFSSLTRKVHSVEGETAATDEAEAEAADIDTIQAADDPRLLALQQQRGPRFGDAIHKILERATAGKVWPDQRALLARELHAQGLRAGTASDAGALEAAGRLIDRVRNADIAGLRLNDLAAANRVVEFEFQFPLRQAGVAQLRAICAAHGYPAILPAHLAHTTLDGMLTGFIDLVFAHDGRYHVLDYKTNWLGARLSDYAAPALAAAMREHHYELQALLYTVALHRHLRGCLDGYSAETHLGESCYLFLRACGLEPGLGIWRRRWPAALILAIDAAFAGAMEAA